MLANQEYIRTSVEVNLFFQRIMKEHLFFLQTNLQPIARDYMARANMLKKKFEQLMYRTLHCASHVVSKGALLSNEFVTSYTLRAEQVNSCLTGASINTGITKREQELSAQIMLCDDPGLLETVNRINHSSLHVLQETISFQENLLSATSQCKVFLSLYPQMLAHDIREAERYMEVLQCIMNRQTCNRTLCDELNFWNDIMAEHARFIDGMLDPTEIGLKNTARATAEEFEKLVDECIHSAEEQMLSRSLNNARGIRSFKVKATEGLLACEMKSVIPPLLADHVLREANHYIRLLTRDEC